MTVFEIFSSGTELASFVTSSHVLRRSWTVISCGHEDIGSNKGEGISWTVYKDPDSDLTIIAFEATLDTSSLEADLVSSDALRENNFYHFEFLCTNTNPNFSVNSTAISLLSKNYHRLDQLKSEIKSSARLIVTGRGLGGSVASLFTVLLLDSIWLGKNRPLCITFGSPLIGDKGLQRAISRSSYWNSCFLHVVSLKDPLPRHFIANHSSSAAALTNQANDYVPFGTFLFCSDVNSTIFENPDSALEFLTAMGPVHVQNQGLHYADYGNIVENLNKNAVCKDLTTRAEIKTRSNPLLAYCISLQLLSLGLASHMQQQQGNIDISTLETKIEKLHKKFIFQSRSVNPFKRLAIAKMDMAQLEWYKKDSEIKGIGYYDCYKYMKFVWDLDTLKLVRNLTNYWEKMVEEAKIKPQKGGAAFHKSWLYAGTSYRRMVEPLAIAKYYREGGKDYVAKNRPKHFVLLEEWFRNEMTKAKTSNVEDTPDLPYDWIWDDWGSPVDKFICSSQGSMVVEKWEDNSMLNTISEDENGEAISSLMVDQLLLSIKKLNIVEENEENFESRVNVSLISCQGSYKDENINTFESHVNVALMSCQGSSYKGESINKFESLVDQAILSPRGSIAVKELEEDLNRTKKKNVEALLTSDSCFWAHVEEALISCKELKVTEKEEEILQKLVEFEEYVYGLLKNYEVSPEIFCPGSSYMRWWNEYKAIRGTSYDSKLASFMKHVGKHMQYALGDYDFL